MDKQQRQEYDRAYYLKNKEKKKAKDKRYRERHKEQVKIKVLEWAKKHPDKVKVIQRRYIEKHLIPNALLLKIEILTHYGNGKCQCINCREERLDCLSLDHMNNDGASDRKINYKTRTSGLYKCLKAEGFPNGFQTLCMNCQWVKKAEYQRQRRQTK